MITAASGVWARTLAQLRRCGGAARECVAYWTGPIAKPGIVDEVVHPRHEAGPGSYELHATWLHEFWRLLHHQQREVRVQVHTHALAAFHSATDDRWPIVHTPGFLSLVVPNFAMDFEPGELFLAEIDRAGVWRARKVNEVLAGLQRGGAGE